MSHVFVDSVGLLAPWDEDDQWHGQAQRAFVPIGDGRTKLITTAFILAECGNAAARHPFRVEANRLREEFESAGMLVWPTEEEWHQAWSAYRRGEADVTGIVDHISFVVMRQLALPRRSPTTGTSALLGLKFCSEFQISNWTPATEANCLWPAPTVPYCSPR